MADGDFLVVDSSQPGDSGQIDSQPKFKFTAWGALPIQWYSVVDSAAFFGAGAVTAQAGNFTTGDKFSSAVPLTVVGVRFYWKSVGAARTVRCRLYASGVSVASVDVAVNASGVYVGTFVAPVAVNQYQDYAATIWETTGGVFIQMDASGTGPFAANAIVGMIQTGPYTITRTFQRSGVGDTVPITTSTNFIFPVEPVFA